MKNKTTILNLIQKNARLSHKDIADSLNISEKEVTKTIKTLESNGVIVSYNTLINDNHPDTKPKIRALIELSIRPEKAKGYDTIAQRISQNSFVIDHYLVSGNYDFLIIMEGDTLQEISEFVSEFAAMENISKTVTHIILKTYKKHTIQFNQPHKEKRLPISP
jgi:DNA-binding Lrp family transcriptional regulator